MTSESRCENPKCQVDFFSWETPGVINCPLCHWGQWYDESKGDVLDFIPKDRRCRSWLDPAEIRPRNDSTRSWVLGTEGRWVDLGDGPFTFEFHDA